MKTYLNQISGIDDAIVSMFMSKRSWTREKELHIRDICRTVLRPSLPLSISSRMFCRRPPRKVSGAQPISRPFSLASETSSLPCS